MKTVRTIFPKPYSTFHRQVQTHIPVSGVNGTSPNIKIDNVKPDTTIAKTENNNEGISVCISAWNTAEYIEECLDSVAAQTWFKTHDNWEILLGVDGCEKTLAKVKEIMHKYKNLKVMMMNENVGTYVTCNTIMKEANYKWLLRFDSDDIMNDNMVSTLMAKKGDADFMLCKCEDFPKKRGGNLGEGQIFIKKSIFISYGGFLNKRCGCDTEFKTRTKNKINQKTLNDVLFKRRSHDNSLINSIIYKHGSKYRGDVAKYIREQSPKISKIDFATTEFKIIFNNTKINELSLEKAIILPYDKKAQLPMEDGVSILISAYGNKEYISEALDSIRKQTYKKYEILVGIDGDLDLLYYIQNNSEKFQDIRLFYYPVNMGPYLIFNSMVLEAKYDKLLRFDSDDILPPTYIEKLIDKLNGYDAVKPYGINFGLNTNQIKTSHGYFIMKKDKFVEIGGFQPWVCDADGEIFDRSKNTLKWNIAKDITFKRRIHNNNLINDKNRGLKSKIRMQYREYRKNISPKHPIINYNIIKIKRQASDFCPIISFTTYNRRLNVVSKMLDSILNQTYKPYKIVCSITQKDYDDFPQKYKNKIDFIVINQDLRPHNKYYWSMLKYQSHPIITVDDDYIYDKDLVKTLMKEFIKNEHGVFSVRTHKKTFYLSKLNPYKLWQKEIKESPNKNDNLFATGVGGVLYSPNILNVNEKWLPTIKKYITVDDIVLNYYENIQNIPIYHVTNTLNSQPIKEVQNIGLYNNENVKLNDVAINNLLNNISR